LFLARGADVEGKNNENEIPIAVSIILLSGINPSYTVYENVKEVLGYLTALI
jgi:hypothetical protein